MELKLMDGRMGRLYEAGMTGMWLVNTDLTNLDDLLSEHLPGKIVRVKDIHNSIKFLSTEGNDIHGCVAGWLCDDEVSDG